MAERGAQRPGGKSVSVRARVPRAVTRDDAHADARSNSRSDSRSDSRADAGGGRGRVAQLERECAALRVQLAEAEARVRELEERQNQVADRIAWALDSLHTVMQAKC